MLALPHLNNRFAAPTKAICQVQKMQDAKCIDALGRIEGRMTELLTCMTELAGNLKEPELVALRLLSGFN